MKGYRYICASQVNEKMKQEFMSSYSWLIFVEIKCAKDVLCINWKYVQNTFLEIWSSLGVNFSSKKTKDWKHQSEGKETGFRSEKMLQFSWFPKHIERQNERNTHSNYAHQVVCFLIYLSSEFPIHRSLLPLSNALSPELAVSEHLLLIFFFLLLSLLSTCSPCSSTWGMH